MAENENLISSLSIDISKLEGQVKQVDAILKQIGENYDPSKITKETKLEFDKLIGMFQQMASEIKGAFDAGTKGAAEAVKRNIKDVSGIIEKQINTITQKGLTSKTYQVKQDNGLLSQFRTDPDGEILKEKQTVKNVQTIENAYKRLIDIERERARLLSQSNSLMNEGTRSATTTLFANNARVRVLNDEAAALKNVVAQHGDIAEAARKAYEAEQTRSTNMISAAKYKAQEVADATKSADSIKTVNSLYSRQKQLIVEIYNLEKRNVTAGSNAKVANQARITALQQELELNKNTIAKQDDKFRSTKKEEEITNLIAKKKAELTTAEEKHKDAILESRKALEQVQRTLISMATYYGGRFLKQMFQDGIEYATGFYDKLNEIRIVTMMSQEEVNKLGASYRALAQDMSVTSSQIADAAVEFYRQGLPEEEVNKRLVETIKYAKISGLSFEESAQLITAATNTMGISAQKAVDVFSYLGDMSASGADEVGKAMQKSSAAASEFGLSFEWLGSYIATVSEQTREAPEIIGTSFNRILARLHTIKANGYNEEDETKVNDVAKALKTVNIELFDQYGEWRDVSIIFTELAGKWNSLNDKQKAYITTTLAGTLQQNKLLALMRDMSKGVEGGSRAFELYAGAIDSAGVSAEKYAIYEDSVKAAQDRLKASLEELYSLINAEDIKSSLNMLADWVRNFTEGMRNIGGSLFGIEAAVIGIGALIIVLAKAVAAFKEFKLVAASTDGLLGAMSGFKLGPIIGAITAVIGIVTLLVGTMSNAKKITIDYAKEIDNATNKISKLSALRDEYVNLAGKVNKTNEENERMKTLTSEIIDIQPNLRTSLENASSGFDTQATAVSALNEQLDKTIKKQRDLQRAQAVAFLEGTDGTDNGASNAYKNMAEARTRQLVLDFFDSTGIDFTNMSEYEKEYFDNQLKILKTKIYSPTGDYERKQVMVLWNALRAFGAVPAIGEVTGDSMVKWFNENETSLRTQTDAYVAKADDIFTQAKEALTTMFQDDNFFAMDEKSQNEAMKVFETSFLNTLKMPEGATYDESVYISWRKKADADVKALMKTLYTAYTDTGSLESVIPPETKEQVLDSIIKTIGIDTLPKDIQTAFKEQLLNPKNSEFFSIVNVVYDNITKAFEGDPEKMRETLQSALFGDEMSNGNFLKYVNFNFVDELAKKWFGDKQAKEEASKQQAEFLEGLYSSANSAVEEESRKLAEATGYMNQLLTLKANAGDENKLLETFKSLGNTITDDILKTYPEVAEVVKSIGEGHYNAAQAVEVFSNAMIKASVNSKKVDKDYVSAFTETGSEIEKVIKLLKKLDKGKEKVNFADIQDLMVSNPILTTLLDDKDALQSELNSIFDGLVQKQKETYSAMMMNSTAFWQQQVQGNSALWQSVSGAYGADAMNFNNIAEVKANIDAKLRQWIGAGWAQLYGSMSSAMSAAASATRSQISALPLTMGGLKQAEALSSQLKQQQGLMGLASQLDSLGSLLGSIKFDSGDLDFGGGSGGGGSGDSKKTAIETLINSLKNTNAIMEFKQKMYQLGQQLHETKSEFQGVIMYLNKEKDLIKAQTPTYIEFTKTLEDAITSKTKELGTLKKGSKEYKAALDELAKLQEAHQEYSEKVLQNTIDLEELDKKLKETNDKIREMEIDLRDTILSAIEDREDKEDEMLQGRIDMENEILDVIKARYEKEKELALDTANAKKDALEEEKSLISEQLKLRKDQAATEDKQVELTKLETQLARISADPTRMKDQAKLREDIAKMREDIAWDVADNEAEAQQKAIDEQIKSIDDYIEYVNNYYEELFKNPQALIEEMKTIIGKTDSEIIAWLEQNSEEYTGSTAATQESMVTSWQDTLNSMRGVIVTHWAEVEAIIAQGEDAIIEFLKANSADYQEAGKLQAEAYVDEWKKQLEDLRNAYKQVADDIATYNYTATTNDETSTDTKSDKKKYKFVVSGKTYGPYYSISAAEAAKTKLISGLPTGMAGLKQAEAIRSATIKRYAKGGYADFTSPVMVDGSKGNGEWILNPKDTKTIKALVDSIRQSQRLGFDRISMNGNIPSGNYGDIVFEGGINVYVSKLADNQDYNEMADKLSDIIGKRVNRGKPIGGVYIRQR